MKSNFECVIEYLETYKFTSNLEEDISCILCKFGKEPTFDHLNFVANKALAIAEHYDVDKDSIYKASILHDISAIIPNKYRLAFAQKIGVAGIREDDIANPIMLHGKISAEIAKRYFGIVDEDVLNAMRYHTTLRSDASIVEQIVFIADKIALDPTTQHNSEYLDDVVSIVNTDVTKACWYYLDWMFTNLEKLVWQRHYDAVAAYDWLNSIYILY